MGIGVDGATPNVADMQELTTGKQEEITLGGVRFDVNEVSRLGSPEKPGRVDVADDTLIWQPYLGVEMYGGLAPEQQTAVPTSSRLKIKSSRTA